MTSLLTRRSLLAATAVGLPAAALALGAPTAVPATAALPPTGLDVLLGDLSAQARLTRTTRLGRPATAVNVSVDFGGLAVATDDDRRAGYPAKIMRLSLLLALDADLPLGHRPQVETWQGGWSTKVLENPTTAPDGYEGSGVYVPGAMSPERTNMLVATYTGDPLGELVKAGTTLSQTVPIGATRTRLMLRGYSYRPIREVAQRSRTMALGVIGTVCTYAIGGGPRDITPFNSMDHGLTLPVTVR